MRMRWKDLERVRDVWISKAYEIFLPDFGLVMFPALGPHTWASCFHGFSVLLIHVETVSSILKHPGRVWALLG